MLEKVAFTMFPVKDAGRARAFYEGTLGLVRGSHSENGVWTEYDLPGGGCLALFSSPGHPMAPGGASLAFEVSDLDGFLARLEAAGVTLDGDMVHSPVCRMRMLRDPDGNHLILHELKPRQNAK